MKTKLTLTIIVALVVLALAASPASAQQYDCGMLEFSLDPSSGPAGTLVTVSGIEAWGDDTLSILWDPVTLDDPPVGSASSDSSGNFTGQFTVPAGASPGAHNVVIDGYDSEDQSVFCAATFTVTAGATSVQSEAYSNTAAVTSLPNTGLPLLVTAALTLGGLGLATIGWRRR